MASILDCKNKKIKISASSITIKDDAGKTRGVVRNVCKFRDLRPNIQIEYTKILRNTGAWGSELMKYCLMYDGKLYFLKNLKTIEFHVKYGYFSESEKISAEKEAAIYDALQGCGVETIGVYLV